MHHHTAAPVPYPVEKLHVPKLKCNINTKPDGTVWLIAGGACNFSSGPGSGTVLTEIRQGIVPTQNARDRDLSDDDYPDGDNWTDGNPWFFNFENDHLGKGSKIPEVQHDAIVAATSVVLDHYELTATNVLSHAEWTRRKIDPFWNRDRRCIDTIRTAIGEDVFLPIKEGDGIGARENKKSDVAAIQALMNRAYDVGLTEDGRYDADMVAAVKKHTKSSNGRSFYGSLFDDLIWDVATRAARSQGTGPEAN